jgi:penicillin-insensitive murein endopeptidase
VRKVGWLSWVGMTLAMPALGQGRPCRSVSTGTAIHGALQCGRRMPISGRFHVLQPFTVAREVRWGTDQLVQGLLWTAEQVAPLLGSDRLALGHLSLEHGGDVPETTSHESGRDVDIPLLMCNEHGQHIPTYYHHFDEHGVSLTHGSHYRFDVARTWKVVEALLGNPHFDVEFVMVYAPLRQMLLDHARGLGLPPEVLRKAEQKLRRPWPGVRPHDNHLHLRIACPPDDVLLGCRDG